MEPLPHPSRFFEEVWELDCVRNARFRKTVVHRPFPQELLRKFDGAGIDEREFEHGFHPYMLAPQEGGYHEPKHCFTCRKDLCVVRHMSSQCPDKRAYPQSRPSYFRQSTPSTLDTKTLEESAAYRRLMKEKEETERKVRFQTRTVLFASALL